MQNKAQFPSGIYPLRGDAALYLYRTKNTLIDLYLTRGFELFTAPVINFARSVSSFKFADNLSSGTLEIVDDITPQISIIDASSQGVKKYCYGQNIIKQTPDDFYSSRIPTQLGAEIYGDESIDADMSVIHLMLESLEMLGIHDITLTIGNVQIFHLIISSLGLMAHYEELKAIFTRKSEPDIKAFIAKHNANTALLDYFHCEYRTLAQIFNDTSITQEIMHTLAIGDGLQTKNHIIYDFTDTKSYDYHSGVIFAAYAPGYPKAIARGGRFAVSPERSGVGFSFDLEFLLQH